MSVSLTTISEEHIHQAAVYSSLAHTHSLPALACRGTQYAVAALSLPENTVEEEGQAGSTPDRTDQSEHKGL